MGRRFIYGHETETDISQAGEYNIQINYSLQIRRCIPVSPRRSSPKQPDMTAHIIIDNNLYYVRFESIKNKKAKAYRYEPVKVEYQGPVNTLEFRLTSALKQEILSVYREGLQ